MNGLSPEIIALIAGVFLLAGIIKGTVGIGLPAASVGMMTLIVEPRVALGLVIFPSFLSNGWQIWRAGGMGATIRRFWIYIACLMGMIAVVSLTLTGSVSTDTLLLVLGLVIILFSVSSLTWSPPFLPARYDRAGQVVSGVASGLLGGLTAIWAPPMVTYLMARRVEKDEFMRATGVMIFMGTLPLIYGFWQIGILTGPSAGLSLALTVPAIAGFMVGEVIRRHLDAERFRIAVLIVFLVMGLNLLRRALF